MKQEVIAGLVYSILALIGIKNELKNKQMIIIPSKGLPVINKWRLIWLNNKILSTVVEEYLDHIKRYKD